MKRTTRRLTVGSLAIAAAAVLAFPSAANAATDDTAEASDISYAQGMYVAGYDEDVAAANGYQIVTDADGNQSSVPVTDEAKARDAAKGDPLAQARSAGSVGTMAIPDENFNEVVGNCGLSYVGAEKGANDNVYFETGWVVRDAVQEWTWVVNAQGFISGGSQPFGGGPEDAEWDGSGNITAIGPGVAGVPAASAAASVILVDGAVCFSGGPSIGFP